MSENSFCMMFFVKLFEIGNIIRGWKGRGTYAPLNVRPTNRFIKYINPMYIDFEEFINSMPVYLVKYLGSLPIYYYDSGKFTEGNLSIGKLYDLLVHNKYPSIMASGSLISTAIYYLSEHYQYNVPGIDISTLINYY